MSNEDHDLLIEIRTLVKVQQDQFIVHVKDEAERIGQVKASSDAAHRRMDSLMIGGILVVLIAVASLVARFI